MPGGGTNGLYDMQPSDQPFAAELNRFRTVNAGQRELSANDYMKTIIEGVNLLRSVDYRGRSVLAFEQVNPFSYALEMRPSRGAFPQFWLGGQITTDAHRLPTPQELFADTDFVMVPRLPYDAPQLTIMMRIYGPYLQEHYRAKGVAALGAVGRKTDPQVVRWVRPDLAGRQKTGYPDRTRPYKAECREPGHSSH